MTSAFHGEKKGEGDIYRRAVLDPDPEDLTIRGEKKKKLPAGEGRPPSNSKRIGPRGTAHKKKRRKVKRSKGSPLEKRESLFRKGRENGKSLLRRGGGRESLLFRRDPY